MKHCMHQSLLNLRHRSLDIFFPAACVPPFPLPPLHSVRTMFVAPLTISSHPMHSQVKSGTTNNASCRTYRCAFETCVGTCRKTRTKQRSDILGRYGKSEGSRCILPIEQKMASRHDESSHTFPRYRPYWRGIPLHAAVFLLMTIRAAAGLRGTRTNCGGHCAAVLVALLCQWRLQVAAVETTISCTPGSLVPQCSFSTCSANAACNPNYPGCILQISCCGPSGPPIVGLYPNTAIYTPSEPVCCFCRYSFCCYTPGCTFLNYEACPSPPFAGRCSTGSYYTPAGTSKASHRLVLGVWTETASSQYYKVYDF